MILFDALSRRRNVAARVAAVTCAAILSVLAASCTSSSFRPTNHLVPGPSSAIAAAPLSANRFAVLAGPATSKGVFIVDINSGSVHRSFGVTREATGLTSEGGNGPLLITVGGIARNGRPIGAVELWSLDGRKSRVVPMPAQARGITRVVQGVAYVLVGNGDARAAVPLTVSSLHVGRAIPLEANAKTLQQCLIATSPYLLYSGSAPNGGSPIVVREVDSGIVVQSTVSGDSPTCIDGRPQVFALQRTFAAGSVVVLSLPNLLQQGLIPAASTVTALYETSDHHLAALNSTSRLSNIEVFSDTALAMKQTK